MHASIDYIVLPLMYVHALQLAPFLGFIFAQVDPQTSADALPLSESSWTRPGVLKAKLSKLNLLRETSGLSEARNISDSKVEGGVYLCWAVIDLHLGQAFRYYFDTFQKHGIRHPLMWYKTRRVCFEEELGQSKRHGLRLERGQSDLRRTSSSNSFEVAVEIPCEHPCSFRNRLAR